MREKTGAGGAVRQKYQPRGQRDGKTHMAVRTHFSALRPGWPKESGGVGITDLLGPAPDRHSLLMTDLSIIDDWSINY